MAGESACNNSQNMVRQPTANLPSLLFFLYIFEVRNVPWGVGLSFLFRSSSEHTHLPVFVILHKHTQLFLRVGCSPNTQQARPVDPPSRVVFRLPPRPRVLPRLLIGRRVFFRGAVQPWSTLPPPPHRQAHHGACPPSGNVFCVLPFRCSPVVRSSCLSFTLLNRFSVFLYVFSSPVFFVVVVSFPGWYMIVKGGGGA